MPQPLQTPAQVAVFAERAALPHGLAVDGDLVVLTEPGLDRPGAPARVVALDAATAAEVGELPPPPGGFRLPFSVRVPEPGRVAVLDNAGFPPQGSPAVHEYRLARDGELRAVHERSVRFDGLPVAFAEDLEVLPDGGFVVSDSIAGALWLVRPDGTVVPGLAPSGPSAPLPGLSGGAFPEDEQLTVGGLPFGSIGGFAPGVGSLTARGEHLYFSSTALGGLHRIALATLLDVRRPAEERAREIEVVSPRPDDVVLESLKGGVFDPADPEDPWLYVGDPFRLRVLRVHAQTGRRELVADDPRLFDFPIAAAFLPPGAREERALLVVSDQEYRWAGLNSAIEDTAFAPPFAIAQISLPGRWPAAPQRRRPRAAHRR